VFAHQNPLSENCHGSDHFTRMQSTPMNKIVFQQSKLLNRCSISNNVSGCAKQLPIQSDNALNNLDLTRYRAAGSGQPKIFHSGYETKDKHKTIHSQQ
jgi:hypothetical protein